MKRLSKASEPLGVSRHTVTDDGMLPRFVFGLLAVSLAHLVNLTAHGNRRIKDSEGLTCLTSQITRQPPDSSFSREALSPRGPGPERDEGTEQHQASLSACICLTDVVILGYFR